MGKPPVDINLEHFIFGNGLYTNTRMSRAVFDESQFRIEPAPTGWGYIIAANAAFVTFFVGFVMLVGHLEPENLVVAAMLCLGVGLMTCTIFTVLVLWDYQREQRQGTWLIYDKVTRSVRLPRLGETFAFGEIVHLQYISTKDLSEGTLTNNPANSEINLVTLRDGKRERWPLLRSWGSHGAFGHVLKPLVRETDIPVVRITDSLLSWDVSIRPYGGPALATPETVPRSGA